MNAQKKQFKARSMKLTKNLIAQKNQSKTTSMKLFFLHKSFAQALWHVIAQTHFFTEELPEKEAANLRADLSDASKRKRLLIRM